LQYTTTIPYISLLVSNLVCAVWSNGRKEGRALRHSTSKQTDMIIITLAVNQKSNKEY
jgi:hypothetical protein